MSNEAEKWNHYWQERASEDGTTASINKAIEQNYPRQEYAEGKRKLDYHHEFSSGHVVDIFENEEGIADILLELPDGKKIDITKEDFIPQNMKFVAPAYSKAHHLDEWSAQGHWRAGTDYIAIGDMKNPESIFSLLHELGHVQPELEAKLTELDTKPYGPTIYEAGFQSVNERGAWSGALHIVRELKKKYRVNLMEIFPSLEAFHEFMRGNLAAHRYKHEFDIIEAGKEILNDAEIKSELADLFDQQIRQNKRPIDLDRAA